ncbi:MAG: hypothetical protein ACREUT_17595 [Steroidobacteraceae bacterium]
MKAFVASTILVFAAIGLASAARRADAPDRPPGVTPSDWVPIDDSFGLVIVHSKGVPLSGDGTALLLSPPVNGYFVVKRGDRWLRVVIVEPAKGPGAAG